MWDLVYVTYFQRMPFFFPASFCIRNLPPYFSFLSKFSNHSLALSCLLAEGCYIYCALCIIIVHVLSNNPGNDLSGIHKICVDGNGRYGRRGWEIVLWRYSKNPPALKWALYLQTALDPGLLICIYIIYIYNLYTSVSIYI